MSPVHTPAAPPPPPTHTCGSHVGENHAKSVRLTLQAPFDSFEARTCTCAYTGGSHRVRPRQLRMAGSDLSVFAVDGVSAPSLSVDSRFRSERPPHPLRSTPGPHTQIRGACHTDCPPPRSNPPPKTPVQPQPQAHLRLEVLVRQRRLHIGHDFVEPVVGLHGGVSDQVLGASPVALQHMEHWWGGGGGLHSTPLLQASVLTATELTNSPNPDLEAGKMGGNGENVAKWRETGGNGGETGTAHGMCVVEGRRNWEKNGTKMGRKTHFS